MDEGRVNIDAGHAIIDGSHANSDAADVMDGNGIGVIDASDVFDQNSGCVVLCVFIRTYDDVTTDDDDDDALWDKTRSF